MSSQETPHEATPPKTAASSMQAPERATEPRVTLREVAGPGKPVRRSFPGPAGAQASFRIAIDRSAHADLIAHARESLSAEVCGVLAGHVCEDDEGAFVHVEAAIRGRAASQASARVTFTQATWKAIYEDLERDHPKLKILGWYHSHPGFGVEFSEMDLFIQRHFFSGPTQIALVTDPLSGALAVCANTPRGIEYLPRFWVDAREQTCQVPAGAGSRHASDATVMVPAGDTGTQLQELESRVNSLVLALDEMRASLYRFLLFAGLLFCLALIGVAGYGIYLQLKARVEPPRDVGFAAVPVVIGGHPALLGVRVVSWQLPPELDVMRQAVEQVRRELEKQLGTNLSAIPIALPATTNGLMPDAVSTPSPSETATPKHSARQP